MRVYHYLEAKWALDDIRRRRLKVSKIDDMNDPYEWESVRSAHRRSQLALDRTKKQVLAARGALCFSRSWNNILMWGHYGDRHRGICLGFDVPDDLTVEISYANELHIVGNLSEAQPEERKRIAERRQRTKFGGWCYEEEVRVAAEREEVDEETGQYFVPFSDRLKLEEVIAGVRCPLTMTSIKDDLKCYSDDVRIIRAARSTENFEIIIDERECW